MREPRNLLLGQNVTPRRRTIRAWKLFLGVLAGFVASDYAFYSIGAQAAHSAPSWPPVKVKLVPAMPEPQASVTAYAETKANWIVVVDWELNAPSRFLGVEPVKDADACHIHVAAEAPYPDQLRAIQEGTAKCFTEAFTREASDPD